MIYVTTSTQPNLHRRINGDVALEQLARQRVHAQHRLREEHGLRQVSQNEGDEVHAIPEQGLARRAIRAVVDDEAVGVRRTAV